MILVRADPPKPRFFHGSKGPLGSFRECPDRFEASLPSVSDLELGEAWDFGCHAEAEAKARRPWLKTVSGSRFGVFGGGSLGGTDLGFDPWPCGCGSKSGSSGYAGFSLWFHLHFGEPQPYGVARPF